ncbi:MAG: peptidylprolyl isomerase [Pirellulales bacterium]|nr:peptidylprolyl isomerase [Pirellulales bacterium]
MIRLFLVWCVCAATVVAARGAEENAASDATPAASFEAEQAKWTEAVDKLREIDAMYRHSNEQQRVKLRADYSASLDQANALLKEMLPSIIAAYNANPQESKATDFLRSIARLSFDGDRFEQALELARLLARDHRDDAVALSVAGHAAWELELLDEARQHWERAIDLGSLDAQGQRLYESLSERRAVLDAEQALQQKDATADNLPQVLLHTTRGDIVLELYEDDVPNTVANFISLVEDGFYDELEFYRVAAGLGAFGGSPSNDGVGGPGHEILMEKGLRGDRPHVHGAISMTPITATTNGSQFFLTLRPSAAQRLDGKQTVFGRVVEGIDVLERFHRVDAKSKKTIFEPERIITATVQRKRDHDYAAVTTAELAQQKYLAGMKLFGETKFKEAEAVFREGLKLDPKHPNLKFVVAASLLNQFNNKDGEVVLREILAENPKHLLALHFLGYVLMNDNRKEEAIQRLEEALKVSPNHRPTMELLRQARMK